MRETPILLPLRESTEVISGRLVPVEMAQPAFPSVSIPHVEEKCVHSHKGVST